VGETAVLEEVDRLIDERSVEDEQRRRALVQHDSPLTGRDLFE